MTAFNPAPADEITPTAPGGDQSPPPRGGSSVLTSRLGRLGPLLLIVALSGALPATAASTLIQALFADVDPANKIAFTGIASTVASIAGAVSVIIAGAISDRTRSRFGRRKPWILGGALVGSIALGLSLTTMNVAILIILYATFQAGLNAMSAAYSALLPDRVGQKLLGRASALNGVGNLLGTAIGGFVASGFIAIPAVGMAVTPWVMVIAGVLLCVFLPPDPNQGTLREPASFRTLLLSMRPPADRDFWLAFVGRLSFFLAMLVLTTYQLFLFTDFYHLSNAAAGSMIALSGVILAIGAGIFAAVTGGLSDKAGRRKPFVVGAGALLALGAGSLFISDHASSFMCFMVVASVAYGTFISVDQALMVEVIPNREHSARDLGFLAAANTVPGMLAPAIAGALVTAFGYPALFVGAIFFAIVSLLCLALIRRAR